MEAEAQKAMSPEQWHFVSRGFWNNWTRDRNRAKLDDIALMPRLLRDVSNRDLSTTVLGQRISFPVMCAPAGGQCGSHPEGELATARAAGKAGTIMTLPVGSGYGLEEVAQVATGPLWFNHIHYSTAVTEELLPRLKPAGYSAVVLTIDCLGPFPLTTALGSPAGVPYTIPMFGSLRERTELVDEHHYALWSPPHLTWDRLDWIRKLSGGLPLVVKGVRTVPDARKCVERGVDAVIVSTHGGRQVDGGLSAIEILRRVVDAVGGRTEIYYDSGIRSGLDVYRALALGARAVLTGRPLHWGLALAGEDGVVRSLEILRAELDRVIAYSGFTKPCDITRDSIEVGW